MLTPFSASAGPVSGLPEIAPAPTAVTLPAKPLNLGRSALCVARGRCRRFATRYAAKPRLQRWRPVSGFPWYLMVVPPVAVIDPTSLLACRRTPARYLPTRRVSPHVRATGCGHCRVSL